MQGTPKILSHIIHYNVVGGSVKVTGRKLVPRKASLCSIKAILHGR
jgi:hypothetical protein